MAVEAPLNKFGKNNLKIYLFVCIGLAIWFSYDGYFSKGFIEKHTKDGIKDDTLVINQKAPLVLGALAVLIAGYYWMVKDKKIVADETSLVISTNQKINYSAIQKIDKTYFKEKGFFTITYLDDNRNEQNIKLSDRKYDNLEAILEHLASKMS